jgi:hypothetical protein
MLIRFDSLNLSGSVSQAFWTVGRRAPEQGEEIVAEYAPDGGAAE